MKNPYVLAALAAAAGIGYLTYEFEKNLSGANDLGKAFDDQQDKLTGLGAHYGSTVTLIQLALDRQKMAEDAVTQAIANHDAALAAIQPAQDMAAARAEAVRTAQDNVTAALNQYGVNSPQYIAAAQGLSDQEYALNAQLLNNWGLAVNVKTAEDNLANARSNLADSTASLNRLQGILNNGLDSGLQVVARFGPTAAEQVGGIATLQNSLSLVVATFHGFTADIQAQVPKINQQLQGTSKALQIYQGQADQLNASLSQAGSYNPQGGKITIQGKRAEGGPVNPGGPYMVGERGMELFFPKTSGWVMDAAKTSELLKNAKGPSTRYGDTYVNIGEINNQQDEAYVLRRLDRNQQLEGMGLTPL